MRPATEHSARDGVAAAQYQDGERRTDYATWLGTLRTAGTVEGWAEAADSEAETEAWHLAVVEAVEEVVHLARPHKVEAELAMIHSLGQAAAEVKVLVPLCHRTLHRPSPASREAARRAEKETRSARENAGKRVLATAGARGCRAGKVGPP